MDKRERDARLGGSDKYVEKDGLRQRHGGVNNVESEPSPEDDHETERERQKEIAAYKKAVERIDGWLKTASGEYEVSLNDTRSEVEESLNQLTLESEEYASKYSVESESADPELIKDIQEMEDAIDDINYRV